MHTFDSAVPARSTSAARTTPHSAVAPAGSDRRPIAAVLLALLTALFMLVSTVQPAAAHDEMISSDPESGAALEASLCVARTRVSTGAAGTGLFPRQQVASTRLAVIGMGKTGARELNYVSDVDVIFVGGGDDALEAEVGESRIVDIATRLAVQTMRGISGVDGRCLSWACACAKSKVERASKARRGAWRARTRCSSGETRPSVMGTSAA